MTNIIQLPVKGSERRSAPSIPPVRTSAVYVLFTSVDETLAAARVADDLARAMDVPLTLLHLRAVPYALALDEPTGGSPVQTAAFLAQLRADGVEASVRVCLCRSEQSALSLSFQPHSLIVIGGRRGWWLSQSARWRRRLEAAGHVVVFVNAAQQGGGRPIEGNQAPPSHHWSAREIAFPRASTKERARA